MTPTPYLHFTIGPVQGFVSQARRTRDFWGGSFLLSWLAGVAMCAVEKQDGTVVFPIPDPEFLNAVRDGSKGPKQGTIPNRFMAEKNGGGSFTADEVKAVVQVVQDAWKALANLVWESDFKDKANSGKNPFWNEDRKKAYPRTKDIWQRQVDSFWDIAWVLTATREESDALDRRKNWRSHLPPSEPGAKCHIMDGLQELSGIEGEKGSESDEKSDRGKRVKFWKELREQLKSGTADLAGGEELCAVAFIKRRFARAVNFPQLKATLTVKGDVSIPVNGWEVSPFVPSVMYLAAAHWLEKVIVGRPSLNSDQPLTDLLAVLKRVSGNDDDEYSTRINCIEEAIGTSDPTDVCRQISNKDGKLFFHNFNNLKKLVPNPDGVDDLGKKVRNVSKLLNLKEPSPYYAVLLMDGDQLGKHMGSPDNQARISTALAGFTKSVPDVIKQNNGFLVYAGGDDVLALLPLEDALQCAAELRARYLSAFNSTDGRSGEIKVESQDGQGKSGPVIDTKTGQPAFTTISAAVIYAHVHVPLGRVLSEAHELLDKVAKDRTGRDSIAVRVRNTGGNVLEWSQPWRVALGETTAADRHDSLLPQSADPKQLQRNGKEPTLVIDKLAAWFDNTGVNESFSSKYLYKFREIFDSLNPPRNWRGEFEKDKDGEYRPGAELPFADQVALMTAEYLSSGVNLPGKDEEKREHARKRILPLLHQAVPAMRESKESKAEIIPAKPERTDADAALLVRHLATKGMGRQ